VSDEEWSPASPSDSNRGASLEVGGNITRGKRCAKRNGYKEGELCNRLSLVFA